MMRKVLGITYLAFFVVLSFGGIVMDSLKGRVLWAVSGGLVTVVLAISVYSFSVQHRAVAVGKAGWLIPIGSLVFFVASFSWDITSGHKAVDLVALALSIALVLPAVLMSIHAAHNSHM